MDYTVTSYNGELGNTTGRVEIKMQDNSQAFIGITEYANWQYAGIPHSEILYMDMALATDEDATSGNVSTTTIDGTEGLVVLAHVQPTEDRPSFFAIAKYWPGSKDIEGFDFPIERTLVEIISTLPEEQSMSLLNSIHLALRPSPAIRHRCLLRMQCRHALQSQRMLDGKAAAIQECRFHGIRSFGFAAVFPL